MAAGPGAGSGRERLAVACRAAQRGCGRVRRSNRDPERRERRERVDPPVHDVDAGDRVGARLDGVLHDGGGEGRLNGEDQSRQAGDERRRGRRAAEHSVTAGEGGSVHAARRGDLHPVAVIRPGVELVAAVRRRDREHAGVGGRIAAADGRGGRIATVRVGRAGVSRGGDDERAVALGVLDRGGDRGAAVRAAEREVDHAGAVVGRPVDADGAVAEGDSVAGVDDADREDLAAVADADTADAVVAMRGDDRGDCGAVSEHVGRVRRPVEHVVAGHDGAGEIGLGRVHAAVDDGDDRRRRGGRVVPALLQLRQRVRRGAGRSAERVVGIVGHRVDVRHPVALDIPRRSARTQRRRGAGGRARAVGPGDDRSDVGERAYAAQPGAGEECVDARRRRAVLEGDEHLAGRQLRARRAGGGGGGTEQGRREQRKRDRGRSQRR